MVNQEPDVGPVFAALADPTRRAMVSRLSRGPCSVGELGEPFAISAPAITKHVKVLERAGLLRRRRQGRVHQCSLNRGPLDEAADWLERQREFWQPRLDALADYLEGEEER